MAFELRDDEIARREAVRKGRNAGMSRPAPTGSGPVRFDAADPRGLMHALAEMTVRHRVSTLGTPADGHTRPVAIREGGSSLSVVPELGNVDQAAVHAVRIFELMHSRQPTDAELSQLRRAVATRFDVLGDRHEAATPLQK